MVYFYYISIDEHLLVEVKLSGCVDPDRQISKLFEHKIVNILLRINFYICSVCPKNSLGEMVLLITYITFVFGGPAFSEQI